MSEGLKLRIAPSGYIEIYRKKEWKKQYCPHAKGRTCNDDCVKFDEPLYYDAVEDKDDWASSSDWTDLELSICDKVFELKKENFEDLR